ncbi:MAG: hypothetical protein M1840_003235 [Geoglossum simile]|nr:MAG: hypothetical protein M1840_003235 [Geoglossum simile]
MLLFPIYQDDRWTLIEVSEAEKTIRYYAPADLSTDIMVESVKTCLECEFDFKLEEWAVIKRILPGGTSALWDGRFKSAYAAVGLDSSPSWKKRLHRGVSDLLLEDITPPQQLEHLLIVAKAFLAI